MEKIMVDTSAIYALIDRSDNNHIKAGKALIRMSRGNYQVLLTNFIVAECHNLILGRLGHKTAREWLKNFCWPVERITAEDERVAQEIIMTHQDKSFSFTDATTFSVMQRLDIVYYFGFDRHFKQFGFLDNFG